MAQDEFVDLYALTGLDPSADTATIRKRLSEAYIDAQNNLDHRNAAKRLQYQQMYEVYLPQARHLLLDPTRRAEYDRYLQAYKSGKPLAEVVATPAPVVESGGIAAVAEDIPEMSEPDVDPEVLAHQREELWTKWKSGLNFSDDEPAAPAAEAATGPAPDAAVETASPASAAKSATGTPAVAPAAGRTAPQRSGQRPPASETARRPQIQTVALGEGKEAPKSARPAGQRMSPDEVEKLKREEWERNREKQRTEIVEDMVSSAGLTWSLVGGGATFVVALIILFVIDSYFSGREYPLGMSRLVFTIIGFFLSVGLAAIGAVITAGKMRDKVRGQIGKMTLEELQRLGK